MGKTVPGDTLIPETYAIHSARRGLFDPDENVLGMPGPDSPSGREADVSKNNLKQFCIMRQGRIGSETDTGLHGRR